MRVDPGWRRRPSAASVLVLAGLLAVCLGATTALAAVNGPQTPAKKKPPHVALAGTWSGSYDGAYSGKFTLVWKQSGTRLGGSITLSNPRGKYGISGSVTRGGIKFGVVGVGAKYTGKQSGSTMSGHYTSPGGAGTWSAHKTS
ncbi:MAG TPA: hypothetical protein VH538_08925 [Gaiellaceae bacterium]